MMKSLMWQQQKAAVKGLFTSRRLRDFEARIRELSDEIKLLKADKERALKCVEMLETKRGKPYMDSVEYTTLAEEKAKLTEELCLEKSLPKASQTTHSVGKQIHSFLWEREGIGSFIRGQTRVRSLEVGTFTELFY